MKSRFLFITILLFSTFPFANDSYGQSSNVQNEFIESIRNSIELLNTRATIIIGDERIFASNALPLFYERRGFQPVWTGGFELNNRIYSLINTLKKAHFEGLRGENYHLSKIETLVAEIKAGKESKKELKTAKYVRLELLLTDAFLVYGSHLLSGKVNPETLNSEWMANRRQTDLAVVLESAITSNQIENSLKELLPPQLGYNELKSILKKYIDIEKNGGWSILPENIKFRKGEQDSLIINLRRRLFLTGDFPTTDADKGIFDEAVETALKKFQVRHGLDADGVMGKATIKALNVPVSERIGQIEVNMERWRWLPQDLGSNHIRVDIANFTLSIYENGQNTLNFKVIVGKDYRRTPVFSDKITYIVLSPYWNVPNNIAVQDILPQIKNDIGYLRDRNIRIYRNNGNFDVELDPSQIDWSTIAKENFGFVLRQDPGPNNALGDVKFMFPNKFNVYIHDTPSKALFEKTERAFSSGCIRIEKPLDLAEYLLRNNPKWDKTKIMEIISKRTEYTVRLDTPTPIHILYWTAWVDKNGVMQFRKDLYERDKSLYDALFEEPSIEQK